MKLAKKLLAAVSALAMAATMLSSVAVVNAASDPAVELKIAESTEGTGLYNISVALDVTQCAGGDYVYCVQFTIPTGEYIDASSINETQMNEETFEDEYINLVYGPGKFATANANFTGDSIIYAYLDMGGTGQRLPAVRDIITFENVKLKDGVQVEDIELGFSEFLVEVGANTGGTRYTLDVDTLNKITFPGNKPDEPTPVPPVLESLGVFEPTGAEAEAMPNQRAVASIATIAADEAATGVTWSIDVVSDDPKYNGTHNMYFPLAGGITSEMKFGLIVEYDTEQAESVTITNAVVDTAPAAE